MTKAVAVNGSPRMDKGNTAVVLEPFIQGMSNAGSDVKLFYAKQLKIKPCTCSEMFCWYEKPGECCIKDDMELLYPELRAADILILATPVYIPLPGAMQNVINRLCPLLKPLLETRNGRTHGRFQDNVRIRKIVLVSTSGWWEKANFGTVVRIAKEFAGAASVEYAGAVLRPHAYLMKMKGELTEDGKVDLNAAEKAGYELVKDGKMNKETLDATSRPLISEQELIRRYNNSLPNA